MHSCFLWCERLKKDLFSNTKLRIMSGVGHSHWNAVVTAIIEGGKHFDLSTCVYEDELSLMRICQEKPSLRDTIRKWLSKLKQKKERTCLFSNDFREMGNEEFDEINGPNDLATDYYTNAIFTAPKGSIFLAMAHANRAASLVTSDRFYEEGYADCKLALNLNYPAKKLPKLFERMLYLAEQTHQCEKHRAETYLEMKKRKIKLKNEQKSFLDEYQAKVNAARSNGQLKRDDADRRNDQVESDFKNKNLIEKTDSSVRRYMITETPIAKNELLYREKAFAFVPTYIHVPYEVISYACQNCAKIDCLPFPCYDCARASYCSPTCLAEHEPIHRFECKGHQKNLWIKVGIGYLAFRTCIVGFRDLVLMLADKKASTVEDVWSALKLDQCREFSYGHILRLVSLVDKEDLKQVLEFALTTELMIIYLSEYTDFFFNLPEICAEIMPNVEDWKMLVAALMLKHMLQAFPNSKTLAQPQLLPPAMYKKAYGFGSNHINLNDLHLVLRSKKVFTSFFPKISLMNHSCDPNVRIHQDGTNLYAHALRDIGANEEIYVSYGPDYEVFATAERRKELKKKFFLECKCNRCVSNNDESYLKYYKYYCPNDDCTAMEVELHGVDKRWWYYADLGIGGQIDNEFVCHECGQQLSVTPALLRKFGRAAQGQIDKGYTFQSTDDHEITSNMLDLYFRMSKGLGKYHEMKTRLAASVLSYNILDSDETLFPYLAYITMENFVNTKERYGIYTHEFILAASYALCILKIANRIERTNILPAMARDIAKIRNILDRNVIENSFAILPQSLQMIFRNALRDVDFDEKSVDELPLERWITGRD